MIGKIIKRIVVLVLIAVAVVLILITVLAKPSLKGDAQIYGVTFSPDQATGLGLDWQETYQAMLNDLGVKHLRLSAYWNEIEPLEGEFDFSRLDYQMDEAQKAGAKVVLSVGRKLPRWPECHDPVWTKGLSREDHQEKILTMLEVVVERYRNHPALEMWQLENEPLLDYGVCPSQDPEFLAEEEKLLKSLDSRMVMVTDSGELNWWIEVSGFGDVVGTTMYRTVFSQRTQKIFHYDYLFPAWVYRLKARIVYILRGKEVIISELQGEPWGKVDINEMTKQQRVESLSVDRLGELQRFAKRTQMPRAYWWGVEYWYWEKELNKEPGYWELAKSFF